MLPPAARAASPAELRERIEVERRGRPFVVLRDASGKQLIAELEGDARRVTIGRGPGTDVALPWDEEVSRVHAELERVGGEWTVADEGPSRSGTFVNGDRISARRRLRDGDVLRVGRTLLAFRRPWAEDPRPTAIAVGRPAVDDLPATQRAVLVALARPYRHDEFAIPATNTAIGRELHLSVDAVKGHLRALFAAFGIAHLPQGQKRARLVAEALQQGVIDVADL